MEPEHLWNELILKKLGNDICERIVNDAFYCDPPLQLPVELYFFDSSSWCWFCLEKIADGRHRRFLSLRHSLFHRAKNNGFLHNNPLLANLGAFGCNCTRCELCDIYVDIGYTSDWLAKEFAAMVVFHKRNSLDRTPFSKEEREECEAINARVSKLISLKEYDDVLLELRGV